MSADPAAVDHAEAVMLQGDEAARLTDAVRRVVHASRDVLSGGRHLDGEDLAALRRATARLTMAVYTLDGTEAEVIDLAAERRRRR